MKSKFGNALLLDTEGYAYRSSNKAGSKTYWRCRSAERNKCKARAVTQGEFVVSWSGMHNHSVEPVRTLSLNSSWPAYHY